MKSYDYHKIKAIDGNCGKIKESVTRDIGFARANMRKGLSTAHYHKKLTEHYLVLEASGAMRVKTKSDIKEIKLRPGILVKIEPGEIHQAKTHKKLIVEVITQPVWNKADEVVVDEELLETK